MSLVNTCSHPYNLGYIPYCGIVTFEDIILPEIGEYIIQYRLDCIGRFIKCTTTEPNQPLQLDHGHFPLNKEIVFRIIKDDEQLLFDITNTELCGCEETEITQCYSEFKMMVIVSVESQKQEIELVTEGENLDHCG